MRILFVAHGHPASGPGGGEIAAYRQCEALRGAGHEVLYLSRAAVQSGRGGTVFSTRGPHDVLFHTPDFDHFRFSTRSKWAVYKDFRSLLERFAPEVVHFHHYVHLGLEMIREVRKYADAQARRVPMVLTLHEYLAICNNHGQMVKTASAGGGLCERASPADCHACYPEHSPQDFFLRERFIKSFLGLVDAFVCPSGFLLERYAAWGLPRERLVTIENGQPRLAAESGEPDAETLARRFAFFGQLSALKGVELLLDAFEDVPEPAHLDIHGTLAHQSEAFRERFHEAVGLQRGRVRYHGAYRQDDLGTLMRRVGWIVVPSIWWENSPLVIQEAFNHGRPVICGNLGGPGEKVADLRDGLHFMTGNASDLAACIERAGDAALWRRLRAGITAPLSVEAAMARHLALYERLRQPAATTATTTTAAPRNAARSGRLARV